MEAVLIDPFDVASVGGLHVAVARMLLASLLGGVIGLDREFLNRPAGLRTHILVALAASTFSILTLELFLHAESVGNANSDPIRVVEAVTAGVAFLAAGTIIQSRGQVRGLTTGASLWLAGAVGAGCGVGAYSIAVVATVFALVVLIALRWLEDHIPKKDGTAAAGEDKPG